MDGDQISNINSGSSKPQTVNQRHSAEVEHFTNFQSCSLIKVSIGFFIHAEKKNMIAMLFCSRHEGSRFTFSPASTQIYA